MKNKKSRKGFVLVAAVAAMVLVILLMRACSSVAALDTPVNNTDVNVANPGDTVTTAPTQPTESATEPTEPATEPSDPQITEHEHSYQAIVIAATCTTEGYTQHICECGDQYTDEATDVLPHSWDQWAVVKEPTTLEKGLRQRKCQNCEAVEETAIEKMVESHVHSYNADTIESTCTDDGYMLYTCDCGYSYVGDTIPAAGHQYDTTVVAPTCEAQGYTIHMCAVCDYRYADSYVSANGHSYNNGKVTTDPTCTEVGVKTFTCYDCKDTYTEKVAKLGHNYESVVTKPDCINGGYTTHTCSACGNTYKNSEVDAIGHNYESVVTAPTCTEKGYTTYTCSNCDDSYVNDKVKALGHSYTNYKSNNDATCAKDGTKTAKCDNGCGEKKTVANEGSALGHDYGAAVTKPTCTKDGYTTYTCSVCDDTYTDNKVEAKGHQWVDANCTAAKTCSVCKATEGKSLGHDYESVVTAPTCTERGYTTHTCNCGDSYIDSYVKANGHTMGDWQAVTRTSCTSDGKEIRYCANCDHSEARVVESTGHNHKAVSTVSATCTTDGYTIYECACGDNYTADVVPATGHSYNSEVVDPTYDSEGYTIHTCANCGDSYKDHYVAALPPVEDEPEEDDSGCCGYGGCCGYHDAHDHIEVKIGKYTYVYCIHITSIYKSADGLFIFYPYEYYF